MNYWLTTLWTDFWLLRPVRRMAYAGGALALWILLMAIVSEFFPMGRPWRIATVASVWVPAVTMFVRRRYSS